MFLIRGGIQFSEKIRDGDNMNNSFRIKFEDSELQQEQFLCSVACQHIMILNNLSVFCVVGKFWRRIYFCLNLGKTVQLTLFLIISVLNILQ
jgi:hypothetical protein